MTKPAHITSPLEGALEWARRGRPVVPIIPWHLDTAEKSRGKRPYIADPINRATTDVEQINAWAETPSQIAVGQRPLRPRWRDRF